MFKCLTNQKSNEQPLHNKLCPSPAFYIHGTCPNVWLPSRCSDVAVRCVTSCSDVTVRCVTSCCHVSHRRRTSHDGRFPRREHVFGEITPNVSRGIIFDYYHSFTVVSNSAECADLLGVVPNHLRERKKCITANDLIPQPNDKYNKKQKSNIELKSRLNL